MVQSMNMDPSPADRETESQDPLLLSSDGAGQHPGGEASAGELTLPGDHATEGASTSLMLVEEVSDERDGSEPSLLASKSGPWVLHSPKESRASILELEQQRLAQGVQERRVEIEPDGYATDDGLKRVPEARGEARRRSICHSRTDGYLSDDEVRPKLKDIPEWTGKAAWFPHRSAGAHGGRVSTELSATKGMAVRDPFADILSHPSPAQAVSTTLSEVDALRKEMADRDEAAVKSAATLEAQLSAVMTMIQHLNARGGATPVQNDGEAPSAATNSHTTGGAQPSAVARSDGNEGNTTDSESVAESSDESIVDGKCPKKKVDVRALGKPVEAPKYSGEDDWPCTLIDWAQNIQGMLLVANLDGDSLRAGLHMGSYMSGRASHLFSREILPELNAHHKSGKRKSKSPWPFDRIVLLLRERFRRESVKACYACGKTGHRIGDSPMKKEPKAKSPILNSDTSVQEASEADELPALEPVPADRRKEEPRRAEKQASRPDVSGGEMEEEQMKPSYPRPVRVPIAINGVGNMSGTVDTGASHTFLHPNAARAANVVLQWYIKLKTLHLGPKGSRSRINAYAHIELRLAKKGPYKGLDTGEVRVSVMSLPASDELSPPTAEDIAFEWETLQKIFDDCVLKTDDAPLEAPPYREVMHEIPFTMPVVDQERIVNLVAGARYVTIGDIQGAFQQLRVRDEDLHKTVFSMPRRLFRSVTAQQGDCNSTVTLDLQMQHMLGDLRGKGVEWYVPG
ncbi:hypothetical protein JCM5296_000043 [Sporobolomyces johnsonii]